MVVNSEAPMGGQNTPACMCAASSTGQTGFAGESQAESRSSRHNKTPLYLLSGLGKKIHVEWLSDINTIFKNSGNFRTTYIGTFPFFSEMITATCDKHLKPPQTGQTYLDWH